MYSFKNSIIVNREIEKVFEFFKNFKELSLNCMDILSIECITKGEIREGSKFVNYVYTGENKASFESEILSCIDNKSLCYKTKRCGVEVIYEYNFIEQLDSTEINLIVDVDVYNYPKELADEIFNIIKEEDKEHIEKIKMRIEENK